jgi:CcmD family protein
MKRVSAVVSAACSILLSFAAQAAALQPAPQSEFVPVSQLPPTEQMPAAPLLIAAYAFVWVAVFAYVWSMWRRLGRVEHEMHELERRTSTRSTAR